MPVPSSSANGPAFLRVTSAEAWQLALSRQMDGHPLQSWAWGEFKSRWGWSASALELVNENDSGTKDSIALAMVLKRRLSRLPFSVLYVPRGPMLDFDNADARRLAFTSLEQLAKEQRAILIKIDPGQARAYGLDEPRVEPIGAHVMNELSERGWRYSSEQIQFPNTVILNLKQSEETLLANMKQKTRYNIRLASRKGVVVRPGTPDDFNLLLKMYMETAERDRFTVRPSPYYLDAWRTFHEADMAQLFIAEYQGTPLGAVMVIRQGDLAIYMYGASTNIERRRMPNYLLQWEAIRWAKAQGCRVYDFWGAPTDFIESDPLWGVWRFKSGFSNQIVKHIGAWDYPARPFWYWIYAFVLPKYLGLLRGRAR